MCTHVGANEANKKCGFPGFIAPEVLKGERIGANSDVFSVGAVLYACLVGAEPI